VGTIVASTQRLRPNRELRWFCGSCLSESDCTIDVVPTCMYRWMIDNEEETPTPALKLRNTPTRQCRISDSSNMAQEGSHREIRARRKSGKRDGGGLAIEIGGAGSLHPLGDDLFEIQNSNVENRRKCEPGHCVTVEREGSEAQGRQFTVPIK